MSILTVLLLILLSCNYTELERAP